MHDRSRGVVRNLGVPVVLALGLVACGGGGQPADEPPPSAEPPAAEAEAASAGPRVFFVVPQDGDEVTSPVQFEFGAEGVSVDPIEDPLRVVPGSIHFHVGYNTDCLPPGTVIPAADPWVHFGDGSSVYETMLDPGEYTITLQAGDGEHRTLEGDGYCETIAITVVEAGAEEEESGQ